jgi:hypothetical protein
LAVRRTLTLDDDVDADVVQIARRSGRSFGEVVNSLLRRGLLAQDSKATAAELQLKTLPLGLRPGLSLTSISQLEAMQDQDVGR